MFLGVCRIRRKTHVPEFLFNKVRPQPATLLKKRFWHIWFSVNFTKFLRKCFYRTSLGDNFCKSTWLYVQHICWMTKIMIYVSWLYVSTDCLVCLIYFCRFADFKLQRNKVQSRKFSFAVMENFDTEFIASLLNENKTPKYACQLDCRGNQRGTFGKQA